MHASRGPIHHFICYLQQGGARPSKMLEIVTSKAADILEDFFLMILILFLST